MKKIILFTALLMVFAIGANAQLSYGVKGGVNFATITNYDNVNIPQTATDIYNGEGSSKYRTGYNFGLLLSYDIAGGLVAFQPELLYSNQGMKNSGSYSVAGATASYSSTMKLDYINLPVMVQIYLLPKMLFIEAGPQIGVLVNSKATADITVGSLTTSTDWDIKDNLNKVDFSLAAGVGFQLPGLPIGVNARYTIGLTNVDKDSDGNSGTHNGVFQVGAFLKFSSK